MFEYVITLLKNQEKMLQRNAEVWDISDMQSFCIPEKISELQKAISILEREGKE